MRLEVHSEKGYNPKLTRAQRVALLNVYNRDRGVASSYRAFRGRVEGGHRSYIMVPWKGMVLGIETDGYTHS